MIEATRIRRGMSMPDDIARAEKNIFNIAYPRLMPVSPKGHYNLRYRNQPFINLWFGRNAVCKREIDCWLCQGEERVGMMVFVEWKISPFVSDRYFIECVDADSALTYNFGTSLVSLWPLRHITPLGTIIEFQRLWVRLDHANGIWAMAANKFIQRQFSRRAALMALQPFPLEYEGNCSDEFPYEAALQSRTAAMMRLYAQALHVQPTPRGTLAGEKKWMWRPFKPEVPPPRRRRLSWL